MSIRFFRWSVLLVAVALLAAGCGDDGDTASDATTTTAASSATTGGDGGSATGCPEAEGKVVGFSEPLPDPNFKIIEGVLEAELKKVGATLRTANANLNPGTQISDVKTLDQQGMDVLVINPVDPNAVQAVIAEVKGKGIPVIAEDTQIGGPYDGSVQSDSGKAAADGAKLIKDAVGDGQVAVLVGPPFAEILERSRKGFEAAAADLDLNIVDKQTNQTITPDAAKSYAEQWKQKYGKDLKAIWTFNDVSAIGVASTFDDSFKPMLVSVNGQPDAIPLVKAGKITATYDLQTDMAGRALAYAAIRAMCKQELPKEIWVGSKVIDESNVADWTSPTDRAKEAVEVQLETRDGKSYVAGS